MTETSLIERIIKHVGVKVKAEDTNIRKLLHCALSAYTDSPLNLAFVAASSEGKSYLVVNSLDGLFRDEDLWILKSVSAKSFTRERGYLAVFNPEEDRLEEMYTDKIFNKFTGTSTDVEGYMGYLIGRIKTIKNEKRSGTELEEEYKRLVEEKKKLEGGLATVVDLRKKIIVFLEEPAIEFWSNFLAVLSHDTYWTKTKFVEGEGFKRTKLVVFKGWPSVIYCTSKIDKGFSWLDTNTRFEILEPTQSSAKYYDAIGLRLDAMFGIVNNSIYKEERKKLKCEVMALCDSVAQGRIKSMTPFEPQLIAKVIEGKLENAQGLVMRKFDYWFRHLNLETLWNMDARVHISIDDEIRIVIARQDLEWFAGFFEDMELIGQLNGLTALQTEYLLKILIPANDGREGELKLQDIITLARVYKTANPKAKIRPEKYNISRYNAALAARGIIKVEKPDEPGRRKERTIELLVGMEDLVNLGKESVAMIVAEIVASQVLGPLRNCLKDAKMVNLVIVAPTPDHNNKKKSEEKGDYIEMPPFNEDIVNKIVSESGYILNTATNTATIPATNTATIPATINATIKESVGPLYPTPAATIRNTPSSIVDNSNTILEKPSPSGSLGNPPKLQPNNGEGVAGVPQTAPETPKTPLKQAVAKKELVHTIIKKAFKNGDYATLAAMLKEAEGVYTREAVMKGVEDLLYWGDLYQVPGMAETYKMVGSGFYTEDDVRK